MRFPIPNVVTNWLSWTYRKESLEKKRLLVVRAPASVHILLNITLPSVRIYLVHVYYLIHSHTTHIGWKKYIEPFWGLIVFSRITSSCWEFQECSCVCKKVTLFIKLSMCAINWVLKFFQWGIFDKRTQMIWNMMPKHQV